MTELRRAPRKALDAVKAGDSVTLTEHGRPVGLMMPAAPAFMPGRELARRWKRHLRRARALVELAENMEGLR
ncbi:MAG: type II toxin-antitoxin system prevent-host-death family antitoxin [Chloroflexaceae bacterium]|nr:type II toxin-antitoxin system prevent-host-death family antitoxin [Chloroflexaceae bacterium]